ncbi:uncharacterized protein LOC115633293 [Scaptodrosophila lebanonensis]|uniref:Uncharacterized protein LOC115633293 n=1 Tax=Drosophila lebanonensis TaxID=7225 RepID=A0A6J2UEI1_DROLE|nr:uncharacterized protein LOC115633293 [Scaptodrosophila lebanonensis]
MRLERYLLWVFAAFVLLWDATGAVFMEEPDLDGYQVVLKRTANRGDKLQIFQSIWGAIRADFPDDTEKVKGLYTQLNSFIQNEPSQCSSGSSTGRTACELQQEVRRHLRQLLVQRLGNLLNAQESIAAYGMYIASTLEPALVRDILVRVVADVYFHRPTEALALQLQDLFTDKDENSFKTMIEAQLALYWHHRSMHDLSNAYLFNAAYILSNIRTHYMYANVDKPLQRRVNELQQNLPQALRKLFDSQGFCLLNKAHHEYVYTTITDEWNYGLNGRQVFTWIQPNYTDSAGSMRAFVQEQQSAGQRTGPSTPIFLLRNEQFQWYFFIDASQGNRLAALRTGSPSSTSSAFSIKYDGDADALIFRQRDLTLCTAEMHDKERRFIKLLSGQTQTHPSDECVWMPVNCA